MDQISLHNRTPQILAIRSVDRLPTIHSTPAPLSRRRRRRLVSRSLSQSEQYSCTGDALALQRRRRMHFWSGLLLLSEDMGVSSEPRGVGAMQASDEHVFISCVRPKIVCFAFLLLSLAKGGGGGGGGGRLGLFLILDSTVVAAGRPRSPKHIMDNHCIVVPIRGLLIS